MQYVSWRLRSEIINRGYYNLCHSIWLIVKVLRTQHKYGKVVMRSLFFALEVNCISNLSPNHTLQMTTLITSVSKSLQLLSKIWLFCGDSLADVQWLLYLQDNGYYCMLFDTCRCDLFQRCMISDGLGSFLSGCVMQLVNNTYHSLFSLSVAMVTTLWLKQPMADCMIRSRDTAGGQGPWNCHRNCMESTNSSSNLASYCRQFCVESSVGKMIPHYNTL